MSKIDLIPQFFNLPISFNSQKMELSSNIITDLELSSTMAIVEDVSANAITNSMYNIILSPSTTFGEKVLPQFTQYYTTDTAFLKDTQLLLKTVEPSDTYDFTSIITNWEEIKGETSFCEKYLYIDWEMGKFLNSHASFLQMSSLYNITSPILSFCLPVLILILPFFIINMKGLNLNISQYTEILKNILMNHAIGKLLTNFSEVSFSEKIYLVLSTALYFFSIYQNVLVCLRFYKNINKINMYLESIVSYMEYTNNSFNKFLSISNKLPSYTDFNSQIISHSQILQKYMTELSDIGSFKFSWKNISNIGKILKVFYSVYENEKYNASIMFSFGFHGYLDNLNGLQRNITNESINFTTFSDKEKASFNKAYYPSLMKTDHIKNDYSFSKNMCLTGPNASGKTTILKTTLCNIIFSQQFGCGCFETAIITPYKFIHCYLNIPDTSGRDSLFQAEARRCKTILDTISANSEDTHFCAFDELYSGTNPDDAINSSYTFMTYLLKFTTISCILTTHYTKVCKKLGKNKNIRNYRMKTIENNGGFEYTYMLEKGISNIKGGLKVLKDMNYPVEITGKQ